MFKIVYLMFYYKGLILKPDLLQFLLLLIMLMAFAIFGEHNFYSFFQNFKAIAEKMVIGNSTISEVMSLVVKQGLTLQYCLE